MDKKNLVSAVVVAAGSGSRMGGDTPKQFLKLNGKPMLFYSLDALEKSPLVDEIIVVTAEEYIQYCTENIIKRFDFKKVEAVIAGGEERYESVFLGLMGVNPESDYVLIHDGARPLLSQTLIGEGVSTAIKYGSAVAAVKSTDTIKIAGDDSIIKAGVDRSHTYNIQTPQIFKYDLILQAYFALTDEDKKDLTDDSSVMEKKTKEKVHLYSGSYENIKVTTESDIEVAERLLEKER